MRASTKRNFSALPPSRPLRPLPRRLLLWPESAVPDYLEPGYRSAITTR